MKAQPASVPSPHQSVWAATVERPMFSPLQENVRTDVCVIGAGIAGLTTAYELIQAGKNVVVLDDGPLAGGMTELTTAHLTCAIDDRYCAIERWHGQEGARLTAQSHSAAIDRIEEIAKNEAIDCDFQRVDGYLFLPSRLDDDMLRQEMEAAHRAGLTDVVRVDRAPFESFESGPALRFPRQGQFHPLKYLLGVTGAIMRDGGRIYCNTHADTIQGGDAAKVTAGDFAVHCDAIVVATNTPINDLLVIHTKQSGYMTYVIGAKIPPGHVERALYWDTENPYHYVRVQTVRKNGEEYELLIVGGEDHKSGQAEDTGERHQRLETWARARFTAMGKIEFTWPEMCGRQRTGWRSSGATPWIKTMCLS
ncbi:MAG: FAD dependent [Desulfovibrionaceae bacterium]|nr:MAG: FAD dependent [Desulfovibrionaceae bacterium]